MVSSVSSKGDSLLELEIGRLKTELKKTKVGSTKIEEEIKAIRGGYQHSSNIINSSKQIGRLQEDRQCIEILIIVHDRNKTLS